MIFGSGNDVCSLNRIKSSSFTIWSVFTLVSGYGSPAGFGNPGPRQGERPIRMDLFKPFYLQMLNYCYSRRTSNWICPHEKSWVPLTGETSRLRQNVQVHKGGKSRAKAVKQKCPSWGEPVGWVPLLPNCREEKGFRPAVLPPGRELKSLDPVIKASRPVWCLCDAA